jgi:hypothetical protein
MWNAKKLSYACKKFVERQNCDATILQGSRRAYQFSEIVVEIVACQVCICGVRLPKR